MALPQGIAVDDIKPLETLGVKVILAQDPITQPSILVCPHKDRDRLVTHLLKENHIWGICDSSLDVREILTLQGRLRQQQPHLADLTAWGDIRDSQKVEMSESHQRQEFMGELESFFVHKKIREFLSQRVIGALEEMCMNAFYDAPVDSEGKRPFNQLSRKENVVLPDNKKVLVEVALLSDRLLLKTEDPFGSLRLTRLKERLVDTISRKNQIEDKEGGAGLGLYMIERNSMSLHVAVGQGQRTVFVSEFSYEPPRPKARCLFLYRDD